MFFYKEPNSYSIVWFLVGIEEIKYYLFDVFIIKVLIDGTYLVLTTSSNHSSVTFLLVSELGFKR